MFNHSNILEPLFWIVMGALYLLFIAGLTYWFKDRKISMNWWKWTLSAIWFIVLSMVIAGSFTLIGENEVRAGLYFLAVFGIIEILLGVALWRFVINKR
jgi:uncharacterized membrane protein YhfC